MHYLVSRKHSRFATGDVITLVRSKRVIKILFCATNYTHVSNARAIANYVVNDHNMVPAGKMSPFTAPTCDMHTDIFQMIRAEEAMGGTVNHEWWPGCRRRLVMDEQDVFNGARFYFTNDKAKIRVDVLTCADAHAPYYLTNECPKHDEQGRPMGPYTVNWWAGSRHFTMKEVLQRINDANPKKLERVKP